MLTGNMDPSGYQKSSPRRPGSLGLAILCVAALGATSLLSYASLFSTKANPLDPPSDLLADAKDEEYRRGLSVALANGGCEIKRARPSKTPIRPVWQASYPGSGARMTWALVQALTGIVTTSDKAIFENNLRGYENSVTVKTHYPTMNKVRFGKKLDGLFDRAIVILRNPRDAIPSWFNWEWERLHHEPTHTKRGPQMGWGLYRHGGLIGSFNEGLDALSQIEMFENFVDYWMTSYPDRSKLLVVSYEEITDESLGPQVTEAIANFLGEEKGVKPITSESIPCVWENIVNYKKHVEIHDANSLRKGPKIRPYTKEMLDGMLATLQRLRIKYDKDEDLVRILDGYIYEVTNTPIEQGVENWEEERRDEWLGIVGNRT
mmetsp:Transcript_13856/g.23636  ORF Transcript_13856/g.23636 Transcript_13856/m.23636 type:complete len:376 (-) Transcript_13856:204-1331(-)